MMFKTRKTNFYQGYFILYISFFVLTILSLLISGCVEDKVDPFQVGTIEGRVTDAVNGLPLKDVEISTAPPSQVVYTDEMGQFSMQGISIGEYSIIPKLNGYSGDNFKVNVVSNKTTTVEMKLSPVSILAPLPSNPIPSNLSIDQPLSVTLQWHTNILMKDNLSYIVTVFESSQIVPLVHLVDYKDTTYVLNNLKYNSTYYWQIQVKSSTGNLTSGELWAFKTLPFPDNRLVFTSLQGGNFEIYSSDENGDQVTKLTERTSFELRPRYSNDRKLIAFSSNAEVDYHIYTMAYDGSNVHKVTTLPIAGYHNQGIGYCWSPDNGKLLYSHYDKLYTIDRNGTNLNLVSTALPNWNFRACDWTPINNKVVVEWVGSSIFNSEIHLMNSDGTGDVVLVTDLPGVVESPSFSIDGAEVMYTQDVSGFESNDGRQLDAHIFTVDINTGTVTDLSANKPAGTNDLQPRFSADGAKIIFMNRANDGSGKKSIWIMDKDGKNRKKIIDNGEMPDWK